MKKFLSILAGIAIFIVIIFAFSFFSLNKSISHLKGETLRMFESFKIGGFVGEFQMADTGFVTLRFAREKNETPKECLSLTCTSSCTVTAENSPSGNVQTSELATFLRNNTSMINDCDKLDVTVVKLGTPPRFSFSVSYSKDATVTAKEKPHMWD